MALVPFHSVPRRPTVHDATAQEEGMNSTGRGSVMPPQHFSATQPDLEFSCPSCSFVNFTSTVQLIQDPEMTCVSCGWQGFPEMRLREIPKVVHEKKTDRHEHSTALFAAQKTDRIATSGQVLEQDFAAQRVEAPIGGMLAVIKQAQQDRYCVGLICYTCFIICFCSIMFLARPVHQMYEIQDSIYGDIIAEAFPPEGANFDKTFRDQANWPDFFTWVDGVLMPKVYNEDYWPGSDGPNDKTFQRAPYSRHTLTKYNRILSAIRFRQVRVKATLGRCERNEDGEYYTEYEQACTQEPLAFYNSCTTPLENHELSRPCWGHWDPASQEAEYPTAHQKETAQLSVNDSRPEQNILCLSHCDAYFAANKQSCAQYEHFCKPGLLQWISSFHEPVIGDPRLQEGYQLCKESCDVTGPKFMGGLSGFKGKDEEPNFCGVPPDSRSKSKAQLDQEQKEEATGEPGRTTTMAPAASDEQEWARKALAGEGEPTSSCFGDVIDLPLDGEKARKLVDAMKRERWLNEATRGISVEINTYNANYDIATALRLIVQVNAGGLLETHLECWSCRLFPYTSVADHMRRGLEAIFMFWLFGYFMIEVQELYQLRLKYFEDFWNFIEVVNLLIYFYMMSAWYAYILNPNLESFKRRSDNEFQDLFTIAKEFNHMGLVSSFNLIWGFIRFFKYFKLSGRIMMLWDSLAESMKGIIPFMLIFMALTVGFTMAGMWLFGDRIYKFHKFSEALLYMVLSVTEGINYEPIKETRPVSGAIWFFTWYAISALILVNFLIAIISDAFAVVKERTHKQLAIEQEARDNGFQFPSLFRFCVQDNCPTFLVPGDAKKKSDDAAGHERILELKETLGQVDLEKLWERLIQGVENEEAAVDSSELAHLFDSEKDARLFIDRISYLANLQLPEPEQEGGTMQDLMKLQTSIDSMDDLLNGCQGVLENAYPALLPHLYPHLYEEVDAGQEAIEFSLSEMMQQKEEATRALQDAQQQPEGATAEAAAEESISREGSTIIKTKGKRFRKAGASRRPPNAMFKQPPRAGDLRAASGALELKKKQTRDPVGAFIGDGEGGKINLGSLGSSAVDQFLSREPLQRL